MANSEWYRAATAFASSPFAIRHSLFASNIRYSLLALLLNNHQRLAEFDRLAVLDQNLRHRAGARRWNLGHRLHGLDDQQRLSDRNLGADLDERLRTGLRSPVGGADHRGGHRTRRVRHGRPRR